MIPGKRQLGVMALIVVLFNASGRWYGKTGFKLKQHLYNFMAGHHQPFHGLWAFCQTDRTSVTIDTFSWYCHWSIAFAEKTFICFLNSRVPAGKQSMHVRVKIYRSMRRQRAVALGALPFLVHSSAHCISLSIFLVFIHDARYHYLIMQAAKIRI